MANVVINDKHLIDIANAIRLKTSGTRIENALVDTTYPEVIVTKSDNALTFDLCEPDTSYQTQYPAQTEPYAIKVDCSTLVEMGAARIEYTLKGVGCYGLVISVIRDKFDDSTSRVIGHEYDYLDKVAVVKGLYDSYGDAEADLAPGYDDIRETGHRTVMEKDWVQEQLPSYQPLYASEQSGEFEFSDSLKNTNGITFFLWRTTDTEIQPCYFYGEVVGYNKDGDVVGTTIKVERPVEVLNTFTPGEMAEHIKSIPQIITAPEDEQWVNFYDLDGTLKYIWSRAELEAATELPPVIEREGLVSDGWNWTLEGLKACGTPMNVAMHYQTIHGGLEVVIKIRQTTGATITSYVRPKYSPQAAVGWVSSVPFTVDWGDGTIERPDYAYPANLSPYYHKYGQAGEYRIKIYADEGDYPNLWYNFDIPDDALPNGSQSSFIKGGYYKEIYHPSSFCFDGAGNSKGCYPAWVQNQDNPYLEIVTWPRDNVYGGYVTGRETGIENHPFGGYYGSLKFLVIPYYVGQVGAVEGQGSNLKALSFSETPADKIAARYDGSIQNLVALKSIYYAPRYYNNAYFPGIPSSYGGLTLRKVAYPKGHNFDNYGDVYNIYLPSGELSYLTDIYVPYYTPPRIPEADIEKMSFYSTGIVKFHVPKGRIDVYRVLEGWSEIPKAAFVDDLEIKED